MNKEYGGYFEIDTYRLPLLHEDAIALNCGRNCLAYLIEANKIKKICMPYFMCDCVFDTAKKYGVDLSFYHIDETFKPVDVKLSDDEWLYVMNYYGQLSYDYLITLKKDYDKIIVDNSQAYFDKPILNTDTLYTCRKFFGVADGAFLYSSSKLDRDLAIDESFERMHFVLGRFERTASEFYAESADNNDCFNNEPIKSMSKLTMNLLHGLDYDFVKQRRTDNYNLYHEKLERINKLHLRSIEGAFAYPLWIENGSEIRKELQKKKIYIPTLWPNILDDMAEDSLEFRYAKDILPLPCDQRYVSSDIKYILEEVCKLCIN